jgi:hypothetical protein
LLRVLFEAIHAVLADVSAASLGILDAPFHRHLSERRLMWVFPPARLVVATDKQVPPSWFRTTSTAFSVRRLQACCILLPILGFAAFRG